jgi:hypothetical protein
MYQEIITSSIYQLNMRNEIELSGHVAPIINPGHPELHAARGQVDRVIQATVM